MINRDINALTPVTAELCNKALQAWAAAGLGVFVTETRRSRDRHIGLWAKGRTTAGPKVTYALFSEHEKGTAFDVAFLGPVAYPNNPKLWLQLGEIGESVGLYWGGRFKGVDSPHFQSTNPRITK